MARGRMLNRSISYNKDVATLVNELGAEAGLIWTWMIAHLDREGRMHGDPEVIKGTVFPRISGILPETIRQTVGRAHDLGLVEWYESGGELYVSFPGFDRQQVGLRKNREPDSSIPPPTSGTLPEHCRQPSGTLTAEGKGMEGNGREGNDGTERSANASAPAPASPEVLRIPLLAGKEYVITEADIAEWKDAYPAVDVLTEIKGLRQWVLSNPGKRKSNGRSFVTRNLKRKQDEGPRHQPSQRPQQPQRPTPPYMRPFDFGDKEPRNEG